MVAQLVLHSESIADVSPFSFFTWAFLKIFCLIFLCASFHIACFDAKREIICSKLRACQLFMTR